MINLSEILPEVSLHKARYEADYYGAAALVAKLAGVTAKRCLTPWFHGVHPDLPPTLRYYIREYRSFLKHRVLVHRADQAALLKQAGYPAKAVGAPFIYVPELHIPRCPNSAIFFPKHIVSGQDGMISKSLLNHLNRLKERFETVAVSVHGECYRDGRLIGFLEENGFQWVRGADIHDLNSLIRMRTIFQSFEYVVSDCYGSHLSYAIYSGAKVLAVEPWDEYLFEDVIQQQPSFWKNEPEFIHWLVKINSWNFVSKAIPHLDKDELSAEEASQQLLWAKGVLGDSYKCKPSELISEFNWNWKTALKEFLAIRLPSKLKSLKSGK